MRGGWTGSGRVGGAIENRMQLGGSVWKTAGGEV